MAHRCGFATIRRSRCGGSGSGRSRGDDGDKAEGEAGNTQEAEARSEEEVDDALGFDEDQIPGDLALLREEWTDKAEEDMAFYVRIQGGDWTTKHKVVLADHSEAIARGGLSKDYFCHNYGWPATLSCHYPKYGIEASHALCREAARRGDYFFSIWADQPDDGYQFTSDDVAGYPETLEWVTFMTEADINGPIFERGLLVRALVPTNPEPADFA